MRHFKAAQPQRPQHPEQQGKAGADMPTHVMHIEAWARGFLWLKCLIDGSEKEDAV